MKLSKLTLTAAVLAASAYVSANEAGPTVKTGTVAYACQSGKKITVRYGFNRQGLPTYASARLGGKVRKMPINLAHSDVSGTMFGSERTYSLATDYTDSRNYRRNGMMITSPKQQIVFKNCEPRR